MNVLKFADKEFAARLTQLAAASSLFDPVVEERARGIIAAVRERGDAALLELTERFDGALHVKPGASALAANRFGNDAIDSSF